MPSAERLLELLERWEEQQRQGQDVSPQELCADFPELQPELEQAISKLKKADPLLDLVTPGPARPPAPEQGSALRSSPWPWVSKGFSSRAAALAWPRRRWPVTSASDATAARRSSVPPLHG